MHDMEKQVWQRVRGQQETGAEAALKTQLQTAGELAEAYGYLLKNAGSRSRDLLRLLLEGEQTNMDCLKGIARLQRQTVSEKILPQSREPARKLLELCYHRSRRAAVDFLAQSAGGEFGEVYRAMADREGKHCVWLAQLLGMQ